jgi:uncharacterized glyoxalase superfamily protein PhnB
MQENLGVLRRGREVMMAHERKAMASVKEIRTLPGTTFTSDGDRVVIHWRFDIEGKDGRIRHLDELAHQRWVGDKVAEERFYYDPKTRVAPTVTAGFLYHDAPAAIEWLVRVFGFQKKLVVPSEDGRGILHAHLTFGNGGIMLGSAEGFSHPHLCRSPRDAGGVGTFELSVYVANVDAHYATAVAQGALIVVPLEDKPYGGRGYSAKDPEGHVWGFASYDPWAD